jgi:hypothetical protein
VEVIFLSFNFYRSNPIENYPAFCHRHQSSTKDKEFYWLVHTKRQMVKGQRVDCSEVGVSLDFFVSDLEVGRTQSAAHEFNQYLTASSLELRVWGRSAGTCFSLGRAFLPLSRLCRRCKPSVLFSGSIPLQQSKTNSALNLRPPLETAREFLHIRAINIGIQRMESGSTPELAGSTRNVFQDHPLPQDVHTSKLVIVTGNTKDVVTNEREIPRFMACLDFGVMDNHLKNWIETDKVM